MDNPTRMEETKKESAKSQATAKEFFRSRKFNWALKITLAAVAGLLVFQLGMYVGFRKARFAYGWGENYQRNFGAPPSGFLGELSGRNLTNAHGLAGAIASIEDGDFVMRGQDEMEKIVTVGGRTAIINGRRPIQFSDLQIGDNVTVIGRPGDDGTVAAEIIRVFMGRPSLPN
jgi:hypothetical protein